MSKDDKDLDETMHLEKMLAGVDKRISTLQNAGVRRPTVQQVCLSEYLYCIKYYVSSIFCFYTGVFDVG